MRLIPRRCAVYAARLRMTHPLRCARLTALSAETSHHICSSDLFMPEHPTVWRTANSIAHLFMAAYMVARARTLEHASRTI